MKTYFASPDRTNEKDIASEVDAIHDNPIISTLLQSVSGLLAVMNENRQIVAINNQLLDVLGLDEPSVVLGLRLGEAIKCVHSHEESGGCGTSKFCSSCGAAIAMITTFKTGENHERKCVVKATKNGEIEDMVLWIKSSLIKIKERPFLMIFAKDITIEQQRAMLERTFFHDINNTLSGLLGASELLNCGGDKQEEIISLVKQSAIKLSKEFEMQKCLLQKGFSGYPVVYEKILINELFSELNNSFTCHYLLKSRELEFSKANNTIEISTDKSLLLRILGNMLSNALEASDDKGRVEIWAEQGLDNITINVSNKGLIPDSISRRIFQRNFTTKSGDGHGLGTYSMKLFGEQILKGKVAFSSTIEQGTIFSITLPVELSERQ